MPDLVTVLITDMEGSTAFTADRGDDVAMELLRAHEALVRGVIAEHGGREIKSMGDGFMIAFDDVTPAVSCALELVARLRRYNEEHPTAPIHLRMGINTGPVIEEGGDLYGTTVNAVARITSKARRGQILVSQATRDGCASELDCRFIDRGLFWLKGLKERWRLFEATTELTTDRPPPTDGRTPFIDREEERSALRALADAAMDGRGSFVFLGGDPGTGKTRLAEEIGAECADRGMRRLIARCFDTGLTNSFGPIIDVLGTLERSSTPLEFRVILGESAPEIARLLPHIRRRYPDVPPPAELPPDQERRYVLTSVRDVLASMARQQPTFVHLDDLHWADEQTLLFLEQLALELHELPLLIVATYTQPELSASRPFETTLGSMQRQRTIQRFSIAPFDKHEVALFLDAFGRCEPPDNLVRILHGETEGNAFFLEEILRHLDDRGALFDAAGSYRSDLDEAAVDLPETVRLTIGRRLETLSPTTRTILTTASFIGRDFGTDLLAEVVDASEDDFLDALDDAERAHLVTSATEGGLVRFRFAHELIRQTFVKDVSLARSQQIHLRVADAIERVHAPDLAEHAADIALHLSAAGRRADRERTIRFSVAAGERALEKAAYQEAARHFDRALALTSDADLDSKARILERLATAERSVGHPDEAIATWNEALAAYESLGDADTVARLCLDAGIQVAWWLRTRDAHALVSKGRNALGDRETPHLAGLVALEGVLFSNDGDYVRAEELLDQALAIARRFDDERVLGRVLYSKAVHHFNFADHARSAEFGQESIRYLESGRDLWNLTNVVGFAAQSLGFLGRFEEAAQLSEGRLELAERLGNWVAYVYIDRARAWRHIATSPDPRRLDADGQRDQALGERLGYNWMRAVGYTRMSYASFIQGDWDEALERAKLAASYTAGPLQGHLGRLVLLHGYRGDHDDAMRYYDELRSWDPGEPGAPNRFGVLDAFLAALEGLDMLGEVEEAARLYPMAKAAVSPNKLFRGWDYRVHSTIAGIGATCAKRWDEAEANFLDAIELVDRLPIRLEQPEAYRFYARMLLRRDAPGDHATADQYIERAREAYEALGMRRHVELTEAMSTQMA